MLESSPYKRKDIVKITRVWPSPCKAGSARTSKLAHTHTHTLTLTDCSDRQAGRQAGCMHEREPERERESSLLLLLLPSCKPDWAA